MQDNKLKPNDKRSIVANIITGYSFKNWSGQTQYIDNINSSQTIVTMPNLNVSVTANYNFDYENIKDVFLINFDRNVYKYDIPAKTLTFLFQAVGFGDIANNNDRIVVGNPVGNGSTEYGMVLQPFSSFVNRTWNSGMGNAYCYIDETHIIDGNYGSFRMIDMSVSPPTASGNYIIPGGRRSVGDIIYNPTASTYIISTYLLGTPYTYQLIEVNSSFGLIKEVIHTYTGIMGLFVYNNVLYALNSINSNTEVYKVINGVFTLYDTLVGKNITGASQHPLCNNLRL